MNRKQKWILLVSASCAVLLIAWYMWEVERRTFWGSGRSDRILLTNEVRKIAGEMERMSEHEFRYPPPLTNTLKEAEQEMTEQLD